MFPSDHLRSYLLLITVIVLAAIGRGACLCRQEQHDALLHLIVGFHFDPSVPGCDLSPWKADTDCCTWEGVECDGTSGNVTALSLYCFEGTGPWPTPGFEQLTDLKYLDLSDSGLSGDLPIENGQLSNLVTLNLSGLDLKRLSLEALIHNLGSLQELRLDEANILVGPSDSAHNASSTDKPSGIQVLSMQWCTINGGRFDHVLTKLPFLSKLALDGTQFIAPAPDPERFAELPSLEVLSLHSCGLVGTFPSQIFRMKNMTRLDVSGNGNLSGVLPEFPLSSALQVLSLSGTKFSGKIPESIRNLQNLTELDLSNCQFHGLIPPFTEWPPMISSIDLSGNNLTGSLPSAGYLSLHNLTSVILRNNSITGVIPASLFSLPSLELLDLSHNNFIGNFLLYPNVSSNLANIDLSNNKLQGPIPKLLSELVGIVWLDLSSNNFNGTTDLGFIKHYKDLVFLSLSYNKLSIIEENGNHSYGEYPTISDLGLASCNLSYVPKFLMHQVVVGELDLSNNKIGGHIPDWIWGNVLKGLNLSNNLFTSVATDLSNTGLFYLDLHSNKIGGAIPLPPSRAGQWDYSNNLFNSSIMPEFWLQIGSTASLSLAHNRLIGEVSHLVCNATEITILDLSFNNFSGLIPHCLLKQNNQLEILNLRGNSFHGSLPQNISKECALQIVDLNGNNLEGKMPVSMVNCRMLQVLDLGNNLIVDSFPEWLGVLPLLRVLVLQSNRFHGPIDHYDMNKQNRSFFSKLQVLDLSSNSFNGSVPRQFLKQFKAMMAVSLKSQGMYVGIVASPTNASIGHSTDTDAIGHSTDAGKYYKESVTVTVKGQETTMVQILSVFMSLDLSNNDFEGLIPDEIGDLKFLKVLNLSRNSFTGGIPPRIVNMMQLESLDLSYNQLSGEIPLAMAQMSFLEVLNISYNHMTGMIPQSGQFLTFADTSFLGNDGLCGKPLPRLCNANDTPPVAAILGSPRDLNWEILSVEAGVVSGLIMVFATTLLWGNGRRWAYWQMDKFLLAALQPWIRGRRH